MNSLAIKHIAHNSGPRATSHCDCDQILDSSTDSTATSTFEPSSSRKTSFDSATSTSYFENGHQQALQRHQEATVNMTTYYHYDEDGKVTTSTLDPAAPLFTRGLPGADSFAREGDIVGAYLASRERAYPARAGPEAHRFRGPAYQPSAQQYGGYANPEPVDQGYRSHDGYGSSGYTGGSSHQEYASLFGYGSRTAYSGVVRSYPDPEEIRHLHTLQSLLPYIQPEHAHNALEGPVMNIVEQDTGVVFADEVPKKMLVLFLGRNAIKKFIRTVQREDNENWSGAATCQELVLPRGKCSKYSMRIIVAWMFHACRHRTIGTTKQIRVPRSTFVACSLAETMHLLGLYRDAMRIDHYIASTHFYRPIFDAELLTLWNCLGEDSRYVYAAIKVVGRRLNESEKKGESVPGINQDMLAMLEQYPELNARVRDPELNEEYRPVFGTMWMKNLGSDTSPTQGNRSAQYASTSSILSSIKSRDLSPAREQAKDSLPVEPENTRPALIDAGANTDPEEIQKHTTT
ncbi:hypothetical protein BDW02DRAFT_568839 [Decorospora gaudefroyi]|uniref:Uncharacterized protein n=1 Tax=Decorospora gaudefroyi TaxID=184978 RepID=A0A6A5KGN7_9PLEO|nr:hypothetical protein BDW02DRAFT_568839 [Decorospora gaudefroyi]